MSTTETDPNSATSLENGADVVLTARQRAQRANAALSTGPRSQEGKAKSSANSRKHGIYARALALEGGPLAEDAEEIESFRAEITRDLGPLTTLEREAAFQVVHSLIQARRLLRYETRRLTEIDPDEAGAAQQLAEAMRDIADLSARVSRRQRQAFDLLSVVKNLPRFSTPSRLSDYLLSRNEPNEPA